MFESSLPRLMSRSAAVISAVIGLSYHLQAVSIARTGRLTCDCPINRNTTYEMPIFHAAICVYSAHERGAKMQRPSGTYIRLKEIYLALWTPEVVQHHKPSTSRNLAKSHTNYEPSLE